MKKVILLSLIALFFVSACAVIQTFQNISRLKYRIHSAADYSLMGIDLTNKKSLKDFNTLETLKLSSALLNGSLPLTFKLNIEALNPNDGTGGNPKTDISIASFPYRLLVNDKELVNGNISQPVFVPGKGESVIIPIQIELDIIKSVKEKSLNGILDILLQIGGLSKSTSNLKLKAQPSLGTPIGNIKYPDEITIVDKTFN